MIASNAYTYRHQNPYPAYVWLHTQPGPYFYQSEDTWLVSCYDQVSFALRDSRLSKQLPADGQSPLSNTILFQDPPNHRRLRDAISIAFSAQSPEDLQAMIGCPADHLIDRIEGQSSIDLMQDFASPFPIAIMAGLLGI
jgi:cytochrome P450